MQSRNRFLDDMAQLATNAMGVAQGARQEAETAFKSMIDRWLADRDFVTREEFDAARAMAQKAREENESLKVRIAALEEAILVGGGAAATSSPERTAESGADAKAAKPRATRAKPAGGGDAAS